MNKNLELARKLQAIASNLYKLTTMFWEGNDSANNDKYFAAQDRANRVWELVG